MKRLYGSGGLWLRKSKAHPAGIYWLRYYVNGTRCADKSDFCLCEKHGIKGAEGKAQKELSRLINKAEDGTLPSRNAKRALVSDLAKRLFKDREIAVNSKITEDLPAPTRIWREKNAKQLLAEGSRRWDLHLEETFGDRKASLITTDDLKDYVLLRQRQKARNATINREMAFLRRAFQLGYDARPRLVSEVPHFPTKLPETPRRGFIEADAFEKVLAAIPEPGLRVMVQTAHRLGFRKSELKNLLVMQVADGWISLFAGATKNSKPRKVSLPPDMRTAIEECCKGKQPDAHVFTWPSGKPIMDFRVAWSNACKAAGVAELNFHDLRRSAVRSIVRKGIPVTVGMRITGHRTRTVFDDYDVTADQDLISAAEKL